MRVQVTIGTEKGRASVVLEARSSAAAVLERLADPAVRAELEAARFASLVIMAGPFEPLPGMTKAGQQTQALLAEGKNAGEVARVLS